MTSSQQMRVIVIDLRSGVDGPFHVAAISDMNRFGDKSARKSTRIVAAAMTAGMTAGIADAAVLVASREAAGTIAADAVETGS